MISNYLEQCNEIIETHLENDDELHRVGYIISKETVGGTKEVIAITHETPFSMPNAIITITNNNISYEHPNFGCFSEEYLFDKLEQDYEIEYISMAFHMGVWDTENSYVKKDYSSTGLQKYLKYCESVGITNMILSFGSESELPDLMNYYQEENQRYKIIAKTCIGKESVVLGYNKGAPSEFVTWRKARDGYDTGHYFSNFKNAWKNYERRCVDMTTDEVTNQKSRIRSQIDRGKHFER